MAEGRKDLSQDTQKAAQVKPKHALVAIDPDTKMAVTITVEELGNSDAGIGGSGSPIFSNDSVFEI